MMDVRTTDYREANPITTNRRDWKQGTTYQQARAIEQNATLLGAEPQPEPGSDSKAKGLESYTEIE
jgi:hypothetical protein